MPQWLLCVCGNLLNEVTGSNLKGRKDPVNSHHRASPPAGSAHCHHAASDQRSVWKQVLTPSNTRTSIVTANCRNTWSGQLVWRLTDARTRCTPTNQSLWHRSSVFHVEVPLTFTWSKSKRTKKLQPIQLCGHTHNDEMLRTSEVRVIAQQNSAIRRERLLKFWLGTVHKHSTISSHPPSLNQQLSWF